QGAGGFYFNYNGTGSISGNVGTLTLSQSSTGSTYMGGNNTFVGTVQITAGTVVLFSSTALGTAGTNSVVMSGASTLGFYSGVNPTLGDLTGASGNSIVSFDGATHTLTISSANSATYAGSIGNLLALTKLGTGTQTLSGNNTYNGATLVQNGKLAINGK